MNGLVICERTSKEMNTKGLLFEERCIVQPEHKHIVGTSGGDRTRQTYDLAAENVNLCNAGTYTCDWRREQLHALTERSNCDCVTIGAPLLLSVWLFWNGLHHSKRNIKTKMSTKRMDKIPYIRSVPRYILVKYHMHGFFISYR